MIQTENIFFQLLKQVYKSIAVFILLLTVCSFTLVAQEFSGTVSNQNSDLLENARVILQYPNTDRDTAYTDNTGYYSIGEIAGIDNLLNSDSEILYRYDGNTFYISLHTDKEVNTARLIGIDGRLLACFPLIKVSSESYEGNIALNMNTNTFIIFTDSYHACKIPLFRDRSLSKTISFKRKAASTSSGYDKNSTKDGFYHLIIETDDQYQPVDSVLENINVSDHYTYDFICKSWPEFFANMFFNLEDKYGNIQQNTNMNVSSLDGSYSFNIQTDDNGDAQITNISIPPTENKLIPDSIDFAVEIPANNYLELARDTLRKVSQGDLIKNYHNLTPKQQEFFANLYTTIVSEQTGNPLNNVLTKMWKENSTDTTTVVTNALGEANFENISIAPINEITPDTIKYFLKFSGANLEEKLDSINLTNGDFNQTYQITENQQPKDYTLVINSQDGEGNNLQGVNWLVLSSDSTLIGQGNTGSNSLDTLQFQNINPNLDIILKSNLNEHSDYRTETNLTAETIENRITNNAILTYLYNLGVVGKDSASGVALDSVDVKAFLNGQLLMGGNSLGDTITNLQTTQPGHTLDLKLLLKRAGYTNSDSIATTITEGVANEVVYDFTPAEYKGVIRTAFVDPLGQNGTIADFIFTNNSLGVADTVYNIPDQQVVTDTVEAANNGPTTYTIKVIPHVLEGNIPLYTTEEQVDVYKDQTTIKEIDPESLEQQQKIKGKVVYGDTKTNATGLDIIIWNSDRTTVLDSIRSTDGTYETGPYATGFEGQMDVHIPTNHPTRKDTLYFGHKGIHIGPKETNTHPPNGGPVLLTNKVTAFKDSVKKYNVVLTPTYWMDAETGMLAKVNPAHIQIMDGSNDYDMPTLKWGETNAYFKPTSENNQWLFDMAERIRNNFGIPFVVNEVGSALPASGINIESLDDTYLNSLKNQMGMNVEVGNQSGLTQTNGTDDLDEINVHSTTDIRLRGAPAGQQGSAFMITESERELLHRMKEATDISSDYYVSIGNYTMPNNLDTTKMVYDHINFSIMNNNRRMRINSDENERIDNGSWTIRPNNNADFYSNTNQSDFYNEERWKHWDSTNIPAFNLKFFQ